MTPAVDVLRCLPVALCRECGRLLPAAEFLSHPEDGSLKCPVCLGETRVSPEDATGCDCDDCLDAAGYMLMENWHKARVPASRAPLSWSAEGGLYDQARLDADCELLDEASERWRDEHHERIWGESPA